jgi:hypothetical protein
MNAKLISRTPVLHRADVQGEVIVETQIVEVDGQRYSVDLWANWANPTRTTRVSDPRGTPRTTDVERTC